MIFYSSINVLGTLCCLIIRILFAETKSVSFNNCRNSTSNLIPYLTSKTPYQFNHGDIERPDGCTPLQIWITSRREIGYPDMMTEQDMIDLDGVRDRIIANYEHGSGHMCSDDITNLRLWQKDPNFYENKIGDLKENKELHLLAKRPKDVFPKVLLLQSDDPKSYNFIGTNYERASSSLISFANVLLNTTVTLDYKDDKLKNSNDCLRRQKPEDKMTEFNKFKDGPYVRQSLLDISQRLGFSETIGFDTVNVMYRICRYETASNPENTSVWCTVFSKEDVMVFEYLNDLDYYYCCGPGSRLTKKLNCGIFRKLFDTFSQLVTGNMNDQSSSSFGQSSNFQSVLTLLKIYQHDEPLLASKYEPLKQKLFDESFINSFSSNIFAILYRCDNTTTQNQFQFHVGENPVERPDCEGPLCDWEYLKREFRPILDQCGVEFCDFLQKDAITSASSTCYDSYAHYLLFMFIFTFSFYTFF